MLFGSVRCGRRPRHGNASAPRDRHGTEERARGLPADAHDRPVTAPTPRCIPFSEAFEKGLLESPVCSGGSQLSLLRRAAVGSVSLRRPRPLASLHKRQSVARAQSRPVGRHPASEGETLPSTRSDRPKGSTRRAREGEQHSTGSRPRKGTPKTR